MPDDVVGDVSINVHGNTTPLERDIQQAAHSAGTEAGKSIDAGIADGMHDTAITDNIVGQVDDAEKPAGESGLRTGKAITRGVGKGVEQNKGDIDAQIKSIFAGIDDSLQKSTKESSIRIREQIDQLLTANVEQRNQMLDRLLGPNLMGDLRSALREVDALLQDSTAEVQIEIDPDRIRHVQLEIDKVGLRIKQSLEKAGEEAGQGLQRGIDRGSGSGGGIRRIGEASGNEFFKGLRKSNFVEKIQGMFLSLGGMAAKWGALISLGVRAAVPLVAGLVSQLGSAAASLGAVGIVGAGAFATLLPGLAAIKIGFSGLDAEAKKALVDKLKAASGELKNFKSGVQKELTPAIIESVKTLSQLAPEVNKFGQASAKAAGVVAKEFSKVLVGRRAEIQEITGSTAGIMQRLGLALTKLIGPALGALARMQPLINRMVNSVADGLENFARMADRALLSGRFETTLERWYDRGIALARGFKNLGTVIFNVFRIAAGASAGFTKSFEKVTKGWADWSNSVKGQNQIKKVFDEAKPVINEVWGLLGDIAGLFGQSFVGDTSNLTDFIRSIRDTVIPTLENLQKIVRESGIQDALYGLAGALLEMVKAGGGSSMRTFIALLTDFVKILSGVLDLLGPLAGPLLAFIGAMRALSLIKKFPGVSGLSGLLSGLVSPANKAKTALEGVTDAANGGGAAGDNTIEKRAGRTSKAIGGITTTANVAAYSLVALTTLQQALGHSIEDSGATVEGFTRALQGGMSALQALGSTHLPAGWVPQRTHADFTALDEIVKDLGTDWSATVDRWGAKHLGIDPADTNASIDVVKTMIEAFGQAAAASGDLVGAKNDMDAFINDLKDRGVDVSLFSDAVDQTNQVLNDLANTFSRSGFTGDFSSLSKGADTFGFAWDDATQKALDGLYKVAQYVDPTTGRLNKKGQEMRRKIIFEADLDSVNGVDNMLNEHTTDKIRKILLNPKFTDEHGNPNPEGVVEIRKAIIKDLEVSQPAHDKAAKKVQAFMDENPVTFQPDFDWSKVKPDDKTLPAIIAKMGLGDLNLLLPHLDPDAFGKKGTEIAARFAGAIGAEKAKLEIDPAFKGHPDLIFKTLKSRAQEILQGIRVQISTEDALDKIKTLTGMVPDELSMELGLNDVQYAQVGDKLLKMTKGPDGKTQWTAVIDSEADTVKAHNDYEVFTKGPGGKGWVAKVVAHADTDKADKDLDALAKQKRNATILAEVKIKDEFLYYNPATGDYEEGGSLHPKAGGASIIPPPEATPSMISMGGPTTMGYGAATPLSAGTRASVVSGAGGGVTGSPNYYSNQDKDKTSKNVTINNYYPEPERVSDTIAMQMRLARYA